jgi:hypothetical protein
MVISTHDGRIYEDAASYYLDKPKYDAVLEEYKRNHPDTPLVPYVNRDLVAKVNAHDRGERPATPTKAMARMVEQEGESMAAQISNLIAKHHNDNIKD